MATADEFLINTDGYWYGDDGDDTIFGGVGNPKQELHGGNGDDLLIGGYQASGYERYIGGGGQDTIRSDYYDGAEAFHADPAD